MKWNAPAPGERDAEERSWHVVRAAWEVRAPHPRKSRRRRGIAVAAVGFAILAAVLSPAGSAIVDSIRKSVRGERNAAPALFSLPSAGRLLLESERGVWVVQRNGSKRLLSGYRDASWSAHGLYLAAISDDELRAIEPNGHVHWSLARRGSLAFPRWSYEGYRVAYLAGRALRVVNGDGTGDHLVAARVARIPPAWQNGSHTLAYVDAVHRVHVVDADTRKTIGEWRVGNVGMLAWSGDGRLLAIAEGGVLLVYRSDGTQVVGISQRTSGARYGSLAPGNPVVSIAFSPSGETLALATFDPVHRRTRITALRLPRGDVERTIFTGAGRIDDISWSPDARWLVMNWKSANQLLFIHSTVVRGVRAVANVRATFGSGPGVNRAPVLDGWCCT